MAVTRFAVRSRWTGRLSTWPIWLGSLCGLLFIRALVQSARVEGDTQGLLYSLGGIGRCLAVGPWTRCWVEYCLAVEYPAPCLAAGKYPLLQYLLALPLWWSGVPSPRIGLTLAYASIAAFVGVLALTWATLVRRAPVAARAAVIVLASGGLLHYSNTSFGEALSAFVATAYVASWLQRRGGAVVGTFALLTCLSKETAMPFAALLGAICAAADRERATPWPEHARQESRRLTGAGAGLALGVALSTAADIFRFGTPYNIVYLREAGWAAPLGLQAKFFAALWIAPNAGLVFFWPLMVLALAAVPVVAWRLRRRQALEVAWLPLIGLALFLVTLTATLAHWWAPFGWWAWGSRLILPWLPPALLLELFAYPAAADALLRPVVAVPARAAVFTLLAAALALPHLSSIFESDDLLRTTFIDRGICPVPDSPTTYAAYYRCIDAQAWTHPSPLLHGYRVVSNPATRSPAIVFVLLSVAAAAWLWRAGRPHSDTPSLPVSAEPG